MKKVLLIILLVIIMYILGSLFPIKIFTFDIDWNEPTTPGELFYYFICLVQAIGTVCAVIIALFNDSIKAFFKKPKLDINLGSDNVLEELNIINSPEDERKAIKYYNVVDISNNGNANADDCEVYLEKISFTGLGSGSPVTIMRNDFQINWNGNEEKKVTYIPIHGKKSFQLFEMLPPEEQGTPGGAAQQLPASLKIGYYMVPSEYRGGKWEATFGMYSPTLSSPIKIEVLIEWDGSWEKRQMEMKSKLKTTITTNNH
ncbi:MAG: hypothetical protein IJP36_02175 [Bacteroides sp.]|nr:hypothetical protein [Bacteroides sp.]